MLMEVWEYESTVDVAGDISPLLVCVITDLAAVPSQQRSSPVESRSCVMDGDHLFPAAPSFLLGPSHRPKGEGPLAYYVLFRPTVHSSSTVHILLVFRFFVLLQ